MQVVTWKKQGRVGIIEMCNKANLHNIVFADQMKRCLDEILDDTGIFSILLTSTDEKNFSQGGDVAWVGKKIALNDFKAIKSFLLKMNTIFKRLLLLPIPVIAAINGHVAGNGALLACACDFRFMRSDQGFFCFPEVDIEMPFLPGMMAFVKESIPDPLLNEMILTGRRFTATDLAAHNVIVKACDNQASLMEEAMAFAASFKKERGIFGELKKRMHAEPVRVIDVEDPPFIDSLEPAPA